MPTLLNRWGEGFFTFAGFEAELAEQRAREDLTEPARALLDELERYAAGVRQQIVA